ncbi:MAG: nucleoside hydrolase [Chloroflexota bacterium]|nr:nucleoside hydrolase [Chloroflexota bacterium]
MNRKKVIIDTDPGIDDAIAILMALLSPGIEIVGFTTTGGNVPLTRADRNVLAILDYLNCNTPVYSGSASPVEGRFRYASQFHGKSGLSKKLPNPTSQVSGISAVDFLVKSISDNPKDITVIALGPLTNLCRLIRTHKDIVRQVGHLIIMGGAINSNGNVTQYAEFNFFSDYIAANEVLSSGMPITLVDLHACRQVSIDRASASNMVSDSKAGSLATELIINWFSADSTREAFEFYDPLAFSLAINRELALCHNMTIAVETEITSRLGESKVLRDEGNIGIVTDVYVPKFFDLFKSILNIRGI